MPESHEGTKLNYRSGQQDFPIFQRVDWNTPVVERVLSCHMLITWSTYVELTQI